MTDTIDLSSDSSPSAPATIDISAYATEDDSDSLTVKAEGGARLLDPVNGDPENLVYLSGVLAPLRQPNRAATGGPPQGFGWEFVLGTNYVLDAVREFGQSNVYVLVVERPAGAEAQPVTDGSLAKHLGRLIEKYSAAGSYLIFPGGAAVRDAVVTPQLTAICAAKGWTIALN